MTAASHDREPALRGIADGDAVERVASRVRPFAWLRRMRSERSERAFALPVDPSEDVTQRITLSRPRRRVLRWLLAIALVGLAAVAVLAAAVWPTAKTWQREGIVLAEAHRRYTVAHPGWSFPARVVTTPLLASAPAVARVAEARARGFLERCEQKPRPFVGPPAPGRPEPPGWYCAKTGEVVPSRSDGFEPLTLGWLIGPEGEIREHLPLEAAPKHLIDAIIAAEDRGFRSHYGVNPVAVLRAAFADTSDGGYVQGASTLSMQIARAFTQRREKTLLRKLREIVIATGIDRHLGKDGVLQAYLDAPYLGQRGGLSICGFQAAARHYYGKDARELDLSEAATLAAILPAPGKFAPDRFPERAKERRDRVLAVMGASLGYDVKSAIAAPIKVVPPAGAQERFPAYLSAVRAWLEARLPPETLYGSGLVVTASIDLAMQAETERLFDQKLDYYQSLIARPGMPPLQAAAVLLDVETGRVRAIYGGRDADATSFNRATQARRQGGSAFKPVVYALAMAQEPGADGRPPFTAGSTEPNAPRLFKTAHGDWRPRNIGGEYSPNAALAHGLAWSQNIATASLLEHLGGPRPLIDFAARLGFDTSHFPEEMGLALGQGEVTPLEMARFAALIANGGLRVEGRPVLRAVDAAGIERIPQPGPGTRVLSAEAAALTRELMRLVIDVGTGGTVRGAGGEAGYPGTAMGKTGTTDGEKDLWFVGATPRYAASVWLGYDRPAGLSYSASDLAAPLWGWWLRRMTAADGAPPAFSTEPKLVRRWICSASGKIAGASCRGINAPFVPGTEPKARCPEDHPPLEVPDGHRAAATAAAEGTTPAYESLWKKLARQKDEQAAAGGSAR